MELTGFIAGFNSISKWRAQADMKGTLKKRLRELLTEVAVKLDPTFELDPAFAKDPHLVAVRRQKSSTQWQFVALSFSTLGDRFFVEAAYSPNQSFPVERVPVRPDLPPHNGMLRFRASSLWRTPNQSGGWLIWKFDEEPPTDSVAKPEGVFETPEAAMDDVKERIAKWVLPHLDSVRRA